MKNHYESSFRAYIRAPIRLLHGSRDGATVTKATIAIFAGGVALSVLAFAAVKIWAACSDYEGPPVSPFICTDANDYLPGSTATIYGTGFQADETIQVQVLHENESVAPGEEPVRGADHEPWLVPADANGEFVTTWHVCEDDCVGATVIATAIGLTSGAMAQAYFTDLVSNPGPQGVPYTQDFSALAHASGVNPGGWQGANLNLATPAGSQSVFPTADPNVPNPTTADIALQASSSASSTGGGVHNYNGKIGLLGSGTVNPSLALAVNTTGQRNIKLTFRIGVVRVPYNGGSETRINAVDAQFRVGTSGTFTSLSGGAGVYTSPAGPTKTTSGDVSLASATRVTVSLPASANNQATVQIRWVQRDVSGGGSRPSFAIDDVVVYEDVDCDISALAQDNADNTPYGGNNSNYTALNGGSGFNAWARTTETGGNASVFITTQSNRLDGNKSFGLFAGSSSGSVGIGMVRQLAFPLSKGSFTVEMRHNVNNSAAFSGFNLRRTTDTVGTFGNGELLSVGLTPGSGNTSVFVGGNVNQTIPLGVELRGAGIQYTVTFDTFAGTYTVSARVLDPLNAGGASGSVSGTLKSPLGCVAGFAFGNFNTGGNQDLLLDALQVNAGDNEDNAVYDNGWQLETAPFTCPGCDNGGFGLGTWADLGNVGAGGGTYVETTGGQLDGSRSFGIFSNFSDPGSDPSGHSVARPLATPLTRGDMSVLIRHNVNNARGFTGLNLRQSFFGAFGNNEKLSVGLVGNNDNNCIYINDSTGSHQAFCFNGSILGKRMLYKVRWDTIANTYSVTVRDLDNSIQPTGTDTASGLMQTGAGANAIESFGFANFNRATSGSGNQNVIVDRLVCVGASSLNCANITTSTDPGLCTAVVTFNPANDSCAGGTPTCTPPSGTAFPKGTTTVTCSGTDSACQPTSCSFTVTVNDTQAPSITCPANVSAQCATSDPGASFAGGTASDNCPGFSTNVVSNVVSGQTCANKYTRTVVFQVTDASGNSAQCTRTITINDTTAPVLSGVPVNQTVQCTAPAAPPVTATDNCDGSVAVSFTETSNGGTGCPANPLILTRTWSATDQCGNSTSATRTVTVSDTTNPTAVCQNITVSLSASNPGTVTVSASQINNGSSDNCTAAGSLILEIKKPTSGFALTQTYGCGEVQNNTVTLRVTDACGNSATCTATVTVQDNTPPTVTCPADAVVQCGGDVSPASTGTATATDNCSATVSFSDSQAAGSCPQAKVITRTWRATDASGNTSTPCVQTINVVDTTAPSVTAPGDTTVECPGDTSVGANGTATATDNCDTTATPAPAVWINEFHYDNAGIDSGEFIEIAGTAGVNLAGYRLVLYNGATPSAGVVYSDTTLSGIIPNQECGYGALFFSYPTDGIQNGPNDGFALALVASTTVVQFLSYEGTMTAVGSPTIPNPAGGTTSTDVGVSEPSSTPIGSSLQLVGAGTSYAQFTWTSPTTASPGSLNVNQVITPCSTSDGSGPTVTSSDSETDDCGNTKTITRTWTATDGCGNSATDVQTITVVDTTPPVITCPVDQTFECDGAGNVADIAGWLASVSATDVCGGTSIVNNYTGLSDDCGATGSALVTFTATDDCGNSSTCSATVTVADTTNPTIVCPADQTFECDGAGNTADIAGWLASVSASDVCGGTSIVNNYTGLSDDCGATGSALVTFTATDDCGNSSTCSATVTVADTTNPTIVCPVNQTFECDGSGNTADIAGWLATVSATDTCGGATTMSDYTGLSDGCGATGSATVTFTATDDCGNTATCSATVTVADTTAPSLTLPADATLECPANTSPSANGIATGGDTCGSVTITYSDASVAACGNTETITRTWKAADDCGNSTTANQTITVVDTTAPSLSVPADATLECPADTSPAANGTATGNDTCGSVTITYSDASLAGCGNTETITRTWKAADDCGNSTTAIQTITVVDTTAPSLSVPADATLECPADTSPAANGTATGSDSCGSVTITYSDATVPGCGNTEIITRTWKATDDCGNSTTADQTITVVDTTAPALGACPANITAVSPAGLCNAVVTYTAPTATDTCDTIPTVTCTPPSGSQFGLGTTTVTCTAKDDCNNSASCSFTVNVLQGLCVKFLQPPLEADNACNGPEAGEDLIINRFKAGSTIPVKIHLYDCTGADVTASMASLVTVKVDVTLRANFGSSSTLITDIAEVYNGVGDVGGKMVLNGNHFQYNLNTSGFDPNTESNNRYFDFDVKVSYNSNPTITVGEEDAAGESKK